MKFRWSEEEIKTTHEAYKMGYRAGAEAALAELDEVVSLVRVWRECPEEKRPSREALAASIVSRLPTPD